MQTKSERNSTTASQVYSDPAIWIAAKGMATDAMTADDLMAELSLVLLDYDPDKLEQKRASHYWRYFLLRVLSNLSKGRVAHLYRGTEQPTEYQPANACETAQTDLLPLCEVELNKLPESLWVDKEIFLAYIRHGTIREVMKHTGLSNRTILEAIKTIRKHIKSKIEL